MQLILKPAEMLKTRVRMMDDRKINSLKMTHDLRRELGSSVSARTSAADVDSLQLEMGGSLDHPAWTIDSNDQPLHLHNRSSLWQ
jgi:hypothetical protein